MTTVETHPGVRGTGSVTLFDGHLYIPASGVLEETGSSGADYSCCTFRGSVSKVNANTGGVVWKTYMMDEPQPRGLSANGVQLFGPAGAGIPARRRAAWPSSARHFRPGIVRWRAPRS